MRRPGFVAVACRGRAGRKELVPRRVLLLDFINRTQKDEYGYLAGTLSDNQYEQMQNTANFELVSKDDSRQALRNVAIAEGDYGNNEALAGIGKLAGVEVVSAGYIMSQALQIKVKVVDVASARVVVLRQKSARSTRRSSLRSSV